MLSDMDRVGLFLAEKAEGMIDSENFRLRKPASIRGGAVSYVGWNQNNKDPAR